MPLDDATDGNYPELCSDRIGQIEPLSVSRSCVGITGSSEHLHESKHSSHGLIDIKVSVGREKCRLFSCVCKCVFVYLLICV